MLPSPRANSSVNWVEVIVKTAIVFGLGWFLVSNMVNVNRGPEETPELKAADKALKANDVAGARAQFDKLLAKSPKNVVVYAGILSVCGTNRRNDLVDAYGQRAQIECKDAPKADQAALYRTLADAYLTCGGTAVAQALPAAEKASELEPNTMDSLNSLAYTIAETTQNVDSLKKAQDLILRALTELNSKTAVADRALLEWNYNDTYAWVLYKEGVYGPASEAPDRFARAANLLIDIVNGLPDGLDGTVESTIYYHLGAVYNKTGQFAQARNMLMVALHYDPGNAAAQRELAMLPAVATEPAPSAPATLPVGPTAPKRTVAVPAITPLPTPSAASR